MIDREYTCRIFKEIIKEHAGRIAIYGLGKYAQILAESMPEDVFCFCDVQKIDGDFFGNPILPLDALPDKGVRTIVIAAGYAAERIVYERIESFCREHCISICGIQSGSLNEVGRNLSGGLKGGAAKDALWSCIEAHDVISFDVFDTLLMRKTLYPMDVFDIVEHRAGKAGISLLPGFRNYRHQAEVASERKENGLRGIYGNLQEMLGLSEEDTEKLLQLEMEVEEEVVFPRQVIVEAGKYAKSLGKKVVLVSDMYLPPLFMEKLLNDNGIDFYDKLYVSDFCGTSKGQKLFLIVKDENPANSYLHIGDNTDSDDWGARRQGLDSFVIKSGLEMFKSTELFQPFKYLDGFNERLLLGLFVARAFVDPFCVGSQGQRHVNGCADFAKLFVAPLAAAFVSWLVERTQSRGFDGVLFAARDGYLFQKMYEKASEIWQVQDIPETKYIYVSRKLCLGLAARYITDLDWIRSKIQGGTRTFFSDVFGLNIFCQGDEDNNDVWQKIMSRKDEIFDKSVKRCYRFKRYLEALGINPQRNYAFVDMCSQGTSQRALVSAAIPNLYGFYFKRYDSQDLMTMGKVETFLPEDNKILFMNNVFEFFFTSDEPSACDIDEDGRVVFNEESRYKAEIDECLEAQDSIMTFFEDYVDLALPCEHVSRTVGQQILELCTSYVFCDSRNVFADRAISNDLVGGRLLV